MSVAILRMKRHIRNAFLSGVSMTIVAAHVTAADSIEIVPPTPVSFETVVARITIDNLGCYLDTASVRVRQEASAIRIDVTPLSACLPLMYVPPVTQDIRLGQFPAGTMSVSLILHALVGSYTEQIANTQFTVSDSAASKSGTFPLVDYTDHWWNAQESGWGMSIMQHPSDRLFAVWFVYNQAGQPIWYSLQPGQWAVSQFASTYTGPIYRTTGPYFPGSFDSAQVTITPVGTGTLSFSSYATGTFSYVIEGQSGSKSITRLPF